MQLAVDSAKAMMWLLGETIFFSRGPEDHINTWILQNIISGIPVPRGLLNPHVYVLFWCPAVQLLQAFKCDVGGSHAWNFWSMVGVVVIPL